MESIETINKLLHAAHIANLDGTADAVAFGVTRLQEVYNGIGPESLPPEIRDKVTRYLSLYAPAALIHDMRYDCSDGTKAAWKVANYEFFANCFRLIRERFAWYDPRRYLAPEAAYLLYLAVSSDGGWQAWLDAKAKREARDAANKESHETNGKH